MKRFVLLFLILMLAPSAVLCAPPKPRPLAGIGCAGPRPAALHGVLPHSLTLYQEPGVGRLAELDRSDIPLLNLATGNPIPEMTLAVTRKKGEWVRVIYDDAGREGWLSLPGHWTFTPWERFLKGREAKLLPGLRKEFYQLRADPSPRAEVTETVNRQQGVRVIEVMDAWMLVMVNLSGTGWIRWKDDDGRLTVAVE